MTENRSNYVEPELVMQHSQSLQVQSVEVNYVSQIKRLIFLRSYNPDVIFKEDRRNFNMIKTIPYQKQVSVAGQKGLTTFQGEICCL